MSLQLGRLSLKSLSVLSPLEGVSDVGFRSLCYSLGAAFTWTEMIRTEAIVKNNKATLDLIDTFDAQTPTGLQLLAKNPSVLHKALLKMVELSRTDEFKHFENISAIDINLGCPSPDVIREGAGPALLKRRSRLKEIFTVLSQFRDSNCMPNIGAVGCKIRLGLNYGEQKQKVYLHVIDAANEAGLNFVTVHGRNAQQRSRDKPTWEAIGECKRAAEMPIIGNGNIGSMTDAIDMIDRTSCDGVMIARAAIYNPWVFSRFVNEKREECEAAYPSLSDVDEMGGSTSTPASGGTPIRLRRM